MPRVSATHLEGRTRPAEGSCALEFHPSVLHATCNAPWPTCCSTVVEASSRHTMTFPVAMIVECDAVVRIPLATKLRQRGLQVVEATTAAEAYGLAEFGRIDVVIATQAFADRERHELGSCLRAAPGPALPLVLLSGETHVDTAIASAVVPENGDVDRLVTVLGDVRRRSV